MSIDVIAEIALSKVPQPPGQSTTGAAVFDFDRTLTHQDTFMPWLAEIAGPRRLSLAIASSALRVPLGNGTVRDRMKTELARTILNGRPVTQAVDAATRLAPRIRWWDAICRRLSLHLEIGHQVLVATGSAEMAVRTLLAERFGQDAPIDVIGTSLGTSGGLLTGALDGPNCIREAKADRVRSWLLAGNYQETWGYGNAPWDLPMLALTTHPVHL